MTTAMTTAMTTQPTYRAAGFFLLRAPILPLAEFTTVLADRAEPAPDRLAHLRTEGRARLRELAGRPRVAQALHVASPSLTAAITRPGFASAQGRKADRAYSSLLRYVTRMSSRPTPYGLFSGVGVGTFEPTTSLRLAADPVACTRTRSDVGWLLALIKEIERNPDLAAQLRVTVNPLLYRVGDRAVLPFADIHGQEDNRQVGFRVTEPAALALELASLPGATYLDLLEGVRAGISGATPEQVRGLVERLWELHVLTSDLRPASTVALPEEDLTKRLDGVPGCADLQAQLRQLRVLASAVDEAGGRAGLERLEELTAHQRRLTPGYSGETYQLDTGLALAGHALPVDVGAAATEAADALLRLGAWPRRHHHLVEYHAAFLERYGVNAEVPLLELLSPELGMEAPPTYLSPPRSYPLPTIPEEGARQRDMVLAALAAEALYRGRDELELTDERLDRLAVWRPGHPHPSVRPTLDLYAQLAAESLEALARGDWRLVVAPSGTTDGARTFGRFFDLLGEESLARLVDYARAEEALCSDAVFAELSYVTPFGRAGNVTVHPLLRRYEICVNTAPSMGPEGQIPLTDILVAATADRFSLRSRRLGKELVVTQSHLLAQTGAPNVCRLLLELSQDGFMPLPVFDWGTAAAAPFLPRVVRGRVVLSPAQWTLSARRLGGDGVLADPDAFFDAVQAWRRDWRVPRHVYLVWMDNRLLMDLEHPLCVDELRTELRRAAGLVPASGVPLQEMLPSFDQAWLTDGAGRRYLNEIVVPLLARDPGSVRRSGGPPIAAPVDGPSSGGGAARLPETVASRRRLVGSEWVYLKLYSAVSQHDDVISGPVPELVHELRAGGLLDRWFYLRYCDSSPHLRLRLRAGCAADVAAVQAACAAWSRHLVGSGLASDLSFVSYDPELERYGGPDLFDLVESVFEVNSDISVELVRLLHRHGGDLDPEVVCVLAMHALCRDWGLDPIRDIRPDAGVEVDDTVRSRFRAVAPVLCDLLAPWDRHPDPVARAQAATLVPALAPQRDRVAAAGARARELSAAGRLTGDERTVLSSLVHMQVNRLLGMDQERERQCHQLWSLARRSIQRRPAT
ncbi:MAG: lantibiotic dehydratase [Pseudonocardiaceae bacterium]